MVRRLIYVSRSLIGADPDGISAILSSSVRWNTEVEITGMLWADGAHFAQVLEGNIDNVGLTMDRIRSDRRHADVDVLLDREVFSRQFGDWSMRRVGDDDASAHGTAFMLGFARGDDAHGQTVLVVDDEATIRHLIDEVLDEAGYMVINVADGAAGIKVLRSGVAIELLITDVGLPGGMNGRQVADAARALRPGLKVLFIIGYAENVAVGNGHLEPGMELSTKPFSMESLAAKVGTMMNEKVGG